MFYIILFFFVTLIFFALGVWLCRNNHDTLGGFSLGAGLVAFIFWIVMLWIGIESCMGLKGKLAAKQAQYDLLIYQLENGLYENGDSGKKALYDQITEWNEDVAEGKILQHDIFLGAFYPNIYDDLELIELE